MTDLTIKGTATTPEINFNPSSGILKMSGRAYSSDINIFYKTLDAWLDEYLSNPCPVTTVELRMDYFNSIFSKLLLVFLEKCKTVIQKDKTLLLKWYLHEEDIDTVDDISRISRIIKFPIEPVKFS